MLVAWVDNTPSGLVFKHSVFETAGDFGPDGAVGSEWCRGCDWPGWYC